MFGQSLKMLCAGLMSSGASLTYAQAGASLVTLPSQGQNGRIQLDGWSWNSGVDLAPGAMADELSVHYLQADVRYQVIEGERLAVGVTHQHIAFGGSDPYLPERATTSHISLAGALGQFDVFDETWYVQAEIGAGHSSTNSYADGEGFFGSATVQLSSRLTQHSHLQMGVSYDGHRSIWPDIPVPYIAYTVVPSRTLRYTLGLPFSEVNWRFAEQWSFQMGMSIVVPGQVKLVHHVTEAFALFIGYQSQTVAFHHADDQDNRRLFLQMDRGELGMSYQQDSLRYEIAAGWGFNGEITRGFDILRDDQRVREFNDGLFARARLRYVF